MGKRVHVAKKYVVEYGNTEAFNWKHDAFFDLLCELGGEPQWVCGDSDEPSDFFECPKQDYHDAVENLQIHIESPEVYLPSDHQSVLDCIKECDTTPEEMLRLMKAYEAEADTSDGYLHFAAF